MLLIILNWFKVGIFFFYLSGTFHRIPVESYGIMRNLFDLTNNSAAIFSVYNEKKNI